MIPSASNDTPIVRIRTPDFLIRSACTIADASASASVPGSVGCPSDAKIIRFGLLGRGSKVLNHFASPSVQLVSPTPCPPSPLTALEACLGVKEKLFNIVAVVSNVVRLNAVGVQLKALANEVNAFLSAVISSLSILPDLSTTKAISKPHACESVGFGTGGRVSV